MAADPGSLHAPGRVGHALGGLGLSGSGRFRLPEARLEQAGAGLLALRLAVVAGVMARSDLERVPGHSRRLHWVDAAASGERGDRAAQRLRRHVSELRRDAALGDGAGDVPLRERPAGKRREHEVAIRAASGLLLGGQVVNEHALERREQERRVRVGAALARDDAGGRSRRARVNCPATSSSPSMKSTSAQRSPHASETRMPVLASSATATR